MGISVGALCTAELPIACESRLVSSDGNAVKQEARDGNADRAQTKDGAHSDAGPPDANSKALSLSTTCDFRTWHWRSAKPRRGRLRSSARGMASRKVGGDDA
jgi:hypothetical protein